jgi:hypothetical protein
MFGDIINCSAMKKNRGRKLIGFEWLLPYLHSNFEISYGNADI